MKRRAAAGGVFRSSRADGRPWDCFEKPRRDDRPSRPEDPTTSNRIARRRGSAPRRMASGRGPRSATPRRRGAVRPGASRRPGARPRLDRGDSKETTRPRRFDRGVSSAGLRTPASAEGRPATGSKRPETAPARPLPRGPVPSRIVPGRPPRDERVTPPAATSPQLLGRAAASRRATAPGKSPRPLLCGCAGLVGNGNELELK